MVPEEFLRDWDTVSDSGRPQKKRRCSFNHSKCLKKCYGSAALSWRENKRTEKLEDVYLRLKLTSKHYRRYYPSPQPPDGPFVVDPAYANLSLRKKSPLPGTSKVPKSILKSSSSRQSSPVRSHSAPSVTPTHIHVNRSAIKNKPKINYKDEGNRYYSNFDREEPSTSYQFQSASSFPRSVLKKSKSKYSSTEYRSNITNVPIQRRESRSIHRDFSALRRRSASLDYYRAPQSYDRTYSLPRRNRPRYLCISPIRIPRDKIKYKKSLANSIPVSSHVYSNESIHDLPYLYLSSDYPYFLRLPPLAIGESPPPSPAPNPSALFGQSYIPDEDLYRFGRYPLYYSTPTTPELVDPAVDPFLNYRNPKEEYITDEEPEEPIRSCSPTSPSPFFPCDSYSNWYYSNYNSWKPRRSSGRPRKSMGRMNAVDQERKIIIEFCHLLEKSKQLFNGLRELPQYGHKQWHSYFGRTFDVYTKLWKFQQQHRDILDKKYGLKRWQIGEIASKIGQLYYHFYLRTSDTTYLHEAYSFYHAIRARCYYTKASEEDRCELMVKKLRYYARFIVVGLLLKKIKLVRELAKELDRQIIEYANTYDPTDQVEWTVVVDEVKAFIQAEPILSIIHPENYCVTLSHRLAYNSIPPLERTNQQPLSLQEVLIVGNNIHQVKFSELTMDMFRILQTLERESAADVQHMFEESPKQKYMSTPCAPSKGPHLDGSPRRDNPHKYLLFKPAPSQVLVYLGSGCHDLPPGGVLLLYISADGQSSKSTQQTVDDASYNMGGVVTTSRSDSTRDNRDMKDPKNPPQKVKEPQCLYPGDLYAYTRRPLFLVIDSDNSYVFQNMPRNFGQPLVVLMSPLEMPPQYHARKHQGNLFTLFLHSPLTAICFCCEVHTMSLAQWERAQTYVDTFMIEVSQIFTRFRVDAVYLSFMCDDFLRMLVFRYIFTEVALRNHTSFKNRNQLPRAMPPLPEDLIEHPSLFHIILDLAAYLQVRHQFAEPQAGPSSSQKE